MKKKDDYLKSKMTISTILVVVFVIGIAIGRISVPPFVPNQALREGGFKYINPVLLCNIADNNQSSEDVDLRKKIKDYIALAKEKDVAVYAAFFGGGGWVGINENEQFSPASMLKVPTMVAYMRYAETHPEILSKQVYYDGSFDDNKFEYFKGKKAIVADQYYTISELLDYMILYSDNNAAILLNQNIDKREIDEIYSDLGIELPDAVGGSDFMSAKTYSRFLRILYSSTYLSREMSEKVLKLMSSVDINGGIRAGVPKGIEVAQKFGEREIVNPDTGAQTREFHDCGIVYPPKKNAYLLCVMTRGKNFDNLQSEISDISKIVYDDVVGDND